MVRFRHFLLQKSSPLEAQSISGLNLFSRCYRLQRERKRDLLFELVCSRSLYFRSGNNAWTNMAHAVFALLKWTEVESMFIELFS